MITAFLAPYFWKIVAAVTALLGIFVARQSGKEAGAAQAKQENLQSEIEARNEAETIRDDVRRDPAPAADWLRENFNRDKR